ITARDLPDHVYLLWMSFVWQRNRLRGSRAQYTRNSPSGRGCSTHPRGNAWIRLLMIWTRCVGMPSGKPFRRCVHRGWCWLAAQVRTTPGPTVGDAEVPPERVMSDFQCNMPSGSLGNDGEHKLLIPMPDEVLATYSSPRSSGRGGRRAPGSRRGGRRS